MKIAVPYQDGAIHEDFDSCTLFAVYYTDEEGKEVVMKKLVEITHDAVLEAFNHPRTIDMDLVRSQETRRILDRIIGFKLSKLLHNKIKSKSAGRVQSVALKLIVEREKEIKKFLIN